MTLLACGALCMSRESNPSKTETNTRGRIALDQRFPSENSPKIVPFCPV